MSEKRKPAKTSETDALTSDNSETGQSVRNTQHSSDMVERVARAVEDAPFDAWSIAEAALEASHHAELVEALVAVREYHYFANPTKLAEAQVCDMVCGALGKTEGAQ